MRVLLANQNRANIFEWLINVLTERISIPNALFMDKKKKEKMKNF